MSEKLADDIILERFDVIACSSCSQPIDTTGSAPFSIETCPSCAQTFRVPARFANFILLEQLGKGGMGAVYKAYDETLGRTVAIKVMQQSIGQDRVFVEQFLQEARALAAINNPHIVQIYSYGEENGQPYIVMELVDGGRLDHIHEKQQVLDEVFVLQTAIQVINGLQAANAAGMTHGDIKPANILYDKQGSAKVADFGLARFSGEKPKPGEIWGTPYYVAPEVVKGQAPNAGSDIYSLGGTLYHLLTGEPPFNAESVTDTVLLRFKEPAPHPHEFQPSISSKTCAILMRMLEMDSFARYPTFESVRKDLADSLANLQQARSGKKPEKKKSAAAPVMAGLVAIALIGVAGFFGFHHFQAQQAQKAEEAQRQRDIAEGRLRQVVRGGKLVWIRVDPDAPAADPAAAKPAPAPVALVNEWTLHATGNSSISQADSGDFRDRTTLTLRAGSQTSITNASKIYLRFSLKDVDRDRLGHATLQLTAGRRGAVKIKNSPYKLHVWALKTPQSWDDLTRWADAPGNDAKSISDLLSAHAALLTSFDIPANPETGDRLQIVARPILQFIQQYPHDDLTLVLTGDSATDHKNGWRFTSIQDTRFQPPTLLLKAN